LWWSLSVGTEPVPFTPRPVASRELVARYRLPRRDAATARTVLEI
jgi:hypothetical protein